MVGRGEAESLFRLDYMGRLPARYPVRGVIAGSLSLLYWWNFPKEAWIWRHLSGTNI